MISQQYVTYTKDFGLRSAMRTAPDRTVRVIGGKRKANRISMFQIPFTDLREVMDVDFLIINEDILSLLSLRDIYKNGM